MSRSFPVFGSWMRFMPTSITAAPSFTISAVISPGTPTVSKETKEALTEFFQGKFEYYGE